MRPTNWVGKWNRKSMGGGITWLVLQLPVGFYACLAYDEQNDAVFADPPAAADPVLLLWYSGLVLSEIDDADELETPTYERVFPSLTEAKAWVLKDAKRLKESDRRRWERF